MRDLLLKLLNLTTSDNDAEALSAIRKANQLLERNEMSWDQFFAIQNVNQQTYQPRKEERQTYSSPTQTVRGKHFGEDVELIFEFLEESNIEDSFILSLRTWYNDKGFLTDKQFEHLEKRYAREIERSGKW